MDGKREGEKTCFGTPKEVIISAEKKRPSRSGGGGRGGAEVVYTYVCSTQCGNSHNLKIAWCSGRPRLLHRPGRPL